MKSESRKKIYDWLAYNGFTLTPDKHQELKKLLQEALPEQMIYREEDHILGPEDK